MIARGPVPAFVALFLAVMLAGGTAKADVITFDTLFSNGAPGTTAPVIGFQLTLADNFVPESFSRQCNIFCNGTGDFSDFTLVLTYNGSQGGVLDAYGDSAFEYTKGSLADTSGSLLWNTSMNTVSLTFGEGVWNATVFTDAFPEACGGSTGCTASGTLDIPEPATPTIFAAGLVGLATLRRKRVT